MKTETISQKDSGENQIVVYQPDEISRIDVRVERNTVWLTQRQMAELFGCSSDNVGLHLRNIYHEGELVESATAEDSSVVRLEGTRKVVRRVRCHYLHRVQGEFKKRYSIPAVGKWGHSRPFAEGVLCECPSKPAGG